MTTSIVESPPPVEVPVDPVSSYFADPYGPETIRSELYGPEHLEAHARQLATAFPVELSGARGPLLKRFAQNARLLVRAHERLIDVYRGGRESIGPAAEWLLDNFHIVSEALREIRGDLPRGYLQELPKLAAGPWKGFPRVYSLALDLIAHTDSGLDESLIIHFVQAYQTGAPLTIGELWAVPIMLRLGLVENLRRLAVQMLQVWSDRHTAETWAARLLSLEGRSTPATTDPFSTLTDRQTTLSDCFVVHLLQAFREQGPTAARGVEWLERHLDECRSHPAEVLRREHQRQAANQVSVGNCVTSLRLLSALDWTVFFERTSLVEAILRDDPAGIYPRQDFATRDRYRRVVEKVARRTGLDERQVARRTLTLARPVDAPSPPPAPIRVPPRNHVGYYLLGPGKPELEADLSYRPSLKDRGLDLLLGHPQLLYFGGLAFALALTWGGLLAFGLVVGAAWPLLALLLAVALVPASEVAVGLVNYLVTLLLPPRVLPKLDFKDGIPADCSTFVVMPCMLLRPESAAVLAERLEVHYLSNPDHHLYFALLTDFADADTEIKPEDQDYLRGALERIRSLNERYRGNGPDRFFLFHRRRQWNPVENCWMGWERKRGKLSEFNRLLRGAHDTSFMTVSSDLEQLPFIRYVITLDADTQLARETARRLLGTLAHPLNQARFDPDQGRVVEGYGILQPRVSLRLTSTRRSWFARIFAGSAGLDPYTTAVSDVYQDLFGSGSFTGKGIYDVDAFQAATGQTFPDNHILSHDLIEGNYARCGLVTDIELLDDFPAKYHAYARRNHRWVRGDWQILPWLLPTVPAPEGRRPNLLPLLERWKILDNLRRSLVGPTLIALLVLGWIALPGAPWLWTALAMVVLALPLLLQGMGVVMHLFGRGSLLARLRDFGAGLPCTAGQVALSTTFLADEARHQVDAVTRTLVRMTWTRRHLLEWETAATTERRLGTGLTHFCVSMWPAVGLAVVLGVAVGLVRPEALPAAAPLLLAWLVSPLVAFWVSQPRRAAEAPLTAAERGELRRVARKTWAFFETFVGEEDHWLPPDNYQEDPKGEIAHRTSPTNQGLLLLSTLAAHDFGYLSLTTLVDRLEKTFATLDRLERSHGHFHNWYDTRTLKTLQPGYISTVDSGNLMACFLALKQGLREKVEEPIPPPALRDGLADTLDLVAAAVQALTPPAGHEPEADDPFPELHATIQDLRLLLKENPADLGQWQSWLERLDRRAANLPGQVQALAGAIRELPRSLQRLARGFADQVHDRRDELERLAPWAALLRQGERWTPFTNLPALSPKVSQRWWSLQRALNTPSSPAEFHAQAETVLAELDTLKTELPQDAEVSAFLDELAAKVRDSNAADVLARCHRLADRARALADDMDFRLLYNEERHLFSVGYNLVTGRLDNAHYDLLASEARLASFLAIARGDADRKHWFQLGRPLTNAAGSLVLLSWGGTMFEYLMPQLLLRSYPGTLLDESCSGAVARQIEYGSQCHIPWGISESAFGALDSALDYQYQSFGVPGLGLKRGLALDLVVAPYATALAVMVRPHAALVNLRQLASWGAEGPFGYYEAIDFTRDRLVKKRNSLVVRSFMAHHQGMSLVALANCLLGNPMPRRFHAEPMVRATELLLQERLPRTVTYMQPNRDEATPAGPSREGDLPLSRHLLTPSTPAPRTHLLSNGQYSVMLTNAGSGSSSCQGQDVTRWREDRTRDSWGQFIYVRDLRSGLVWSAGHHPVCRPADEYEVVYSADKAEFRRFDGDIESHLEITVSPEKNAEVRRLTLTNHQLRSRDLELTSYLELVLGPHSADLAHPAFGKLFLETEFISNADALVCRRRSRSEEQKPIWAVHVIAVEGHAVGQVQYETDRARFLGRGRTLAAPVAMDQGAVLSGTTGPVLDPIFSLRRRLRLGGATTASIAFTTAVADSREEALALADHFRDPHATVRAFELAWAHSQVELRHLHLSPEEAHLCQRLAAHILYAGSVLRADPAVLTANRQGQPGLWRHGISGDRPIVLVKLAEPEELPLARRLLVAHTYWRLKGLQVDLVLLNEHPTGYFEEFHQQLQNLVRASDAHTLIDKPGGVFLRKAGQMAEEDKSLLQAAARVILSGSRGSLASQVDRVERSPVLPERLAASERRRADEKDKKKEKNNKKNGKWERPHDLVFPNGLGGFTPDGREYVIALPAPGEESQRRETPLPWINVVANPTVGFLVSEGGSGYTWAGNSQTNRLTPWNNDPVTDPSGEVIYLRDSATGEVWTPTPWPIRTSAPCTVRHGQGYSVFEQRSHGLAQELLLFVPPDDPIKLIRLSVRNLTNKPRKLSATFYAEWVLGTVRDQAAMNVVTVADPESGALLARNPFNSDFASRVAFAAVNQSAATVTADRTEFLGRNGSPAAPAALERVALSGRVGAALDPCAAIQAPFELKPNETKEIVFFLGQAADLDESRRLLSRYRRPGQIQKAFDEVRQRWDQVLNAVQVRTPNPAMDLLLNRWLLYQVLSCRVWGRSAFYQSGGAYGFRDQLQDVMALVYGDPKEARAHILRAASRQFLEGDVQHWWHPPAGRGIRTRFSDDFLWLPFVVAHYVTTTGDSAILDEQVPFLKGPLLKPDQEEDYGLPETSAETASLFEHCVRALEHGCRFGAHGLPLMGTGDWNDGMNRVGSGGKGESVWDGWFLMTCLRRFAELAETRGDFNRSKRYREQADQLHTAIEEHAWDGRWYRRAYFDDGTPLGSEQNDECQIDSIAQTWAVLSGAGDIERSRQALSMVDEMLVRKEDRLIRLLTPPFDKGKLHPGYIKGYVPGIRENGGQYTHAATWVVQAAALLGQGTHAVELFDLLNPIHHSSRPEDVDRYRVEPYVVVADIYSEPPHAGRGGWTWYTGSAAWLYRVALETILGFHLQGARLVIEPCIAAHWPKFEITYRHRSATYHITVENPAGVERGVKSVTVDGQDQAKREIELKDDGQVHEVKVLLA